jgi:ABC-type multidrug transport system fused ATPase/permease subunit
MLIGMLVETVGVGLLPPALTLLTVQDLGARYPVLAPWMHRLGDPSHARLVVAGMLGLVVAYTVKALFLGFFAWRQAHFVAVLQTSLSQRLFAGYLRQPYTFHLQHNSALLIRNVIGQVGALTSAVQQGLMLTTESLVLLGISALLVSVEPLGALLVMSALGIAGWVLHRSTRSYLLRWGTAFQMHEGMRIQHLQQGLGGAKDVKLLGREDDFLAQYSLHNLGSARLQQRQATLQALPRLWLELLAVVGLAALVLAMLWQGKPIDALLPTLGLFAAAAFRLMPSVNRVLLALQNVRFSSPVIETLHGELPILNAQKVLPTGRSLRFSRALTLEHVGFQYPSAQAPALNEITLSISKGSAVGFVGGSGAGKSTLVDIILGLLTPANGTVRIDGIDIQTNLRGWQDQVGYVPQSIYLTDDTLRRNVAFGLPAEEIDEAAVWRTLKDAQLEDFVRSLPEGLDTVVGERGIRLSGGQRQRIGIARALYHDPKVLVLDEATSSLDTATERGVMEAVRALRSDKTLLIVAHRLTTVEGCDCLFRLEQGRLVDEGETAAVLGMIMITKA